MTNEGVEGGDAPVEVRSVEPRMLDKHYLSRICDQEEDQDETAAGVKSAPPCLQPNQELKKKQEKEIKERRAANLMLQAESASLFPEAVRGASASSPLPEVDPLQLNEYNTSSEEEPLKTLSAVEENSVCGPESLLPSASSSEVDGHGTQLVVPPGHIPPAGAEVVTVEQKLADHEQELLATTSTPPHSTATAKLTGQLRRN